MGRSCRKKAAGSGPALERQVALRLPEEAAVVSIISGSGIDPGKAELLYRIMDESFSEVTAARPIFDPSVEVDIRARLAQKIYDAFEDGVVDPVTLKQIAIRSFLTKPEDVG